MLLEFDQSTVACMTAALESVSRRIPPDRDSPKLRKQIADAMIVSAKNRRRALSDFEAAGMRVLNAALRTRRFGRFGEWVDAWMAGARSRLGRLG